MKVVSQSHLKTKSLLRVLVWFAMLSAPFTSYAMECDSDSDCGEGEYCERIPVPSEAPCFIDEEGNEECEDEPVNEEETLGFCEERPIECMEDSDCPSHLSCGWAGVSPSDSSSRESEGFAPMPPEMEGASPEEAEEAPSEDLPPEPNEQRPLPVEESMMCVFVPSACESDDDCAMDFRCETSMFEVDCAVPEVICEEGEECEEIEAIDCGGEAYTESYCVPNEIECDSDAACPSDWRCRELVEFSCGSDDTDDIAIGAPEPASEEKRVVQSMDEEESSNSDCEETVRSLCVPVGLDVAYGFAGEVSNTGNSGTSAETNLNNSGEGTAPGTGPNDDGSNANENESSSNDIVEDEGGCDAQSSQQSSWMLIFALALLARRRKLAQVQLFTERQEYMWW